MIIVLGVVVPLIWLAWLVVTDWVPMYPLNDLKREHLGGRIGAAIGNYPLPIAVAAGVALHRDWSLNVALGVSALIVVGHVLSWWLPYFGLSTAGQREQYRRHYARTLKLLPTEGRAVVIDVQHMVVGVLSLAMAGTTVLAATA